MSTQVQIRKGNTAQTSVFTGALAELTVDTDKRVLVVHDGTTAGGNPLIKANASITTGQILTSNGSHLLALSNTGTAGTYGNASYIPVVTTDAYGRVSSVTNTAIAISSGVVTGVMTFAQGGANATSYTTGQFLTSNGTSFVSVANTGTAGTYANAAYVPVITTDAYGRVSSITNTAIAIDTGAITSGTIADARLPTKGTAGTYGNAAYIPVITTDAYGRVTGVTNTIVAITASQVSGGTLTGDLSITGNLTVSGTQTIVNTSTVSTNDSLLKLAANNVVGDVLDIGFYGQSNTGSSVTYHGLVRQAAGNFFLFKGLPTDPSTNTLATGSATAANTATLRANLTGGTVSSLSAAIGIADGGTNQTSFTNGIVAYNGTALATLANTGTAGVYGNAAYHPVITTDAYGRVTAVTNTLVQIAASQVTSGVLPFAQGGANNTTYTTGAILTSNGTAFVALSNTGTAGTYANAAYVPVITTDAYGRVSAVTNTAIAIDTAAITSGTIADARLPTKGTAGTYANATYVPVITTDAYGRVTGITNTAIAITSTSVTGVMTFAQGGANATTYTTGGLLTSNGTSFVSVANTGTAGTYGNAAYHPVITTDAYGRVSAVTNTLVQIAASQVTSGVLPFAQGGSNNTTYTTGAILTSNGTAFVALANTGTAGTYANAAYIPVITTDAYGRVSAVTNTAVAIDTSQITSGTLADSRLPTKGTAGTYANSTYIPVITTDAYGRVTAITNTVIQSSTTSVQGIVQLTDSISSTSTTTAATPNSVKTAYDLAATKFNSSGGTVSGDTTITGNLIVNGTTTTVNTSTVSTSDSLLKLANNNTAGDSLDIGFYGTYNATGQKYAGLVRQAGSNFFLFKDLTTDPTSNALATGSLTASNTATLRANITGGTVSSLASAIGVADGGTGATSLTAGGILIGSGTSAVTILANTGTAGTYGNAAYHPVITTDTYGRVSAVTNTLIQIATTQITSGVLPFAQGGANAITYTTGTFLTSNGTAFVSVANTGTAGTYANAAYVPVITTDAYGRVSAVTNTAIAIDTAAITSGTLADARLPATGTAGTYANAAYVPVITTDSKGRVTAITNTAIVISAAAITSGTLAVAQGGTGVTTSTGTGSVVLNTAPTISLPTIDNIKMGYSSIATAAGTTTLTSASNNYQRFTGSTTQTVVLPVTSTLVAGVAYEIENASTGNLTVNSSGGNLVVTIIPGVTVQCKCIGTTLTTAADWDAEYNEFSTITGTGSVVLNTAPTLTSINVTNTTVSTSNTTGAITVAGGIGVKGNVSANGIIFDDGTRQTTAASGGATLGDVLALSIALG